MMTTPIDRLRTDRVPSGFYSAEELNTVGEAMEYITQRLRDAGYSFTAVQVRGDWTRYDLPTQSYANSLLLQLNSLRNVLKMPPELPQVPNGAKPFNAKEANAIDRILLFIEDSIKRMEQSWWRSGEILSGGFNG